MRRIGREIRCFAVAQMRRQPAAGRAEAADQGRDRVGSGTDGQLSKAETTGLAQELTSERTVVRADESSETIPQSCHRLHADVPYEPGMPRADSATKKRWRSTSSAPRHASAPTIASGATS